MGQVAVELCPPQACCAAVDCVDTSYLLEAAEEQVVLLLAAVEGDAALIGAALPRTGGLAASGYPDASLAVCDVH